MNLYYFFVAFANISINTTVRLKKMLTDNMEGRVGYASYYIGKTHDSGILLV